MKNLMLFVLLFTSANIFAQTDAPQPLGRIAVVQESKKMLPLVVVDGTLLNTPTQEDFDKQLKGIDPNSIEKMDVVKGEKAIASIYGAKAENGIIYITTKKKKD
jgi:TonB-dependent Receptor Plug Domain